MREARARVLEAGDAVAQRLLGRRGEPGAAARDRPPPATAPTALASNAAPTRSSADSRSRPVSSPVASCTSSPPGGFGLDRSSPASPAPSRWRTRRARGVREQDGILRAHRRERGVDRIALDRGLRRTIPLLLVPAATADPLAGSCRASRLGHRGHDLVPAARRGEVENRQRVAEAHEVTVPFDEAGHGEPALELDDARRGPIQRAISASDPTTAISAPRIAIACASGRASSSGDDLAAAQHEIGGCRGARALSVSDQRDRAGDRDGYRSAEPDDRAWCRAAHGISSVGWASGRSGNYRQSSMAKIADRL